MEGGIGAEDGPGENKRRLALVLDWRCTPHSKLQVGVEVHRVEGSKSGPSTRAQEEDVTVGDTAHDPMTWRADEG
jgi:hypothetical protein